MRALYSTCRTVPSGIEYGNAREMAWGRSLFQFLVVLWLVAACDSSEEPADGNAGGTAGRAGSSGTGGGATGGNAGAGATGGSQDASGSGGNAGAAGRGGSAGVAGIGGTSGADAGGGIGGASGSGGVSGRGGADGGPACPSREPEISQRCSLSNQFSCDGSVCVPVSCEYDRPDAGRPGLTCRAKYQCLCVSDHMGGADCHWSQNLACSDAGP
jgi:hypothetical protein